jgi:hypothetical protein
MIFLAIFMPSRKESEHQDHVTNDAASPLLLGQSEPYPHPLRIADVFLRDNKMLQLIFTAFVKNQRF